MNRSADFNKGGGYRFLERFISLDRAFFLSRKNCLFSKSQQFLTFPPGRVRINDQTTKRDIANSFLCTVTITSIQN
jgi:hypothetical protein